jgi:hypothetical protein
VYQVLRGLFFSPFFINNNGLCFQFFSYLFNSDPGYNSNISSTGVEVGCAILESKLNSPSRPTYGPFINEILLFPLAILLIFSARSNKSATNITTTGDNHHNNRQQSSVMIHKASLEQQAPQASLLESQQQHGCNGSIGKSASPLTVASSQRGKNYAHLRVHHRNGDAYQHPAIGHSCLPPFQSLRDTSWVDLKQESRLCYVVFVVKIHFIQ